MAASLTSTGGLAGVSLTSPIAPSPMPVTKIGVIQHVGNPRIGNPGAQILAHQLQDGAMPVGGIGKANWNFETQSLTSAGNLSPTTNNEYLAYMILYPGAKASWIELTIKSPYKLVFPAGFAGLSAAGTIGPGRPTIYRMNWKMPGTTGLASASMTFGGALQAADFIYAPAGIPGGIDLDGLEWLGEAATSDESGTTGTDTTYTFTAGKSRPKHLIALSTVEATATGISRARIRLPSIGAFARGSVPAEMPLSGWPRLWQLGVWDPSNAFVLNHKCDSLGGATNVNVAGLLYYEPAP